MPDALPVVYLVAGEGKRLRPLTDERPKALLELGGISLAERALCSLVAAGAGRVVAVTGHGRESLDELGDLVAERIFNPRFADANNVYSLWCARQVVAGGCFIVNSDVLFEDELARRLVGAHGSAVLCASDHGVDQESMKVLLADGRVERLTKRAPIASNPEYVGLTRIDPEHGPRLAEILDQLVAASRLDVYYEQALEQLAADVELRAVTVDGLAWIEIDDHDDLAAAREEILERVG